MRCHVFAAALFLFAVAPVRATAVLQAQVPVEQRSACWDTGDPIAVKHLGSGAAIAAGELLVGIRTWSEAAGVEEALRDLGGEIVGGIPRLRLLRVRLPAGSDESTELLKYQDLVGARYAVTNDIAFPSALEGNASLPAPNDPGFPFQWNLLNTGTNGPGYAKAGADINLLPAWNIEQGDPGIVVAVLDTGVDFNHPDMQGRLLPGYDFVSEDDDPTALDPHGILVTGMIAANANDGFGIAGVDWHCKILPVRVTSVNGGQGTSFDIVQGLDYALANGASVVNMSFGGGFSGPPPAFIEALELAQLNGVILVDAAGNMGAGSAGFSWPANRPETITVGGTDPTDAWVLLFSTGVPVDFVAPAWNPVSVKYWPQSPDWTYVTGTSFAAPQAAGVVALMKAMNPFLKHDDVYRWLKAGARDMVGPAVGFTADTPGWDMTYGHGRLDAYGALAALCSCTGPQPLIVSPPRLSVTTGGIWVCNIDLGPGFAGDPYLILGTTAGTDTGFAFGQAHVPLNPDEYLHYCLSHPNTWPLSGNVGELDASGQGRATITLPPGLLQAADVMVHHACIVYDGSVPRPFASPPKFVSEPILTRVGSAPSYVFKDAFESTTTTWTFDNTPGSAWHIASDGECGAVTRMLAFSVPEMGCNYASVGKLTSKVTSPSFTLVGEWPFTLSFDMIRQIDELPGPDKTTIRIRDEAFGFGVQSIDTYELADLIPAGELTHVEFQIDEGSKRVGHSLRLELEMQVAAFPGTTSQGGAGWFIDNVAVRNDGP